MDFRLLHSLSVSRSMSNLLSLLLCCERAFEEEQIEWYSNISIIKDLHTLINYKGPSVSPL